MLKLFTNLKTKMTLLLLFLFIMLIVSTVGTLHLVMLGSIKSLEEDYVLENVEKTQNAINYQLEYLDTLAFDWAEWDDTYAFIQDLNQSYLDSALTPETIINIGVARFIFINPKGEVVFTAINTDNTVVYSEDSPFEGKQIIDLMSLMNENQKASNHGGFIRLENKPYVFSIAKVKRSDGSGADVGYLFLAKEVSDEFIASINQQYLLNVSTGTLNTAELNSKNQITSDEIVSQILVDDVFGKTILTLQVHVSRNLYRIANKGLTVTVFALVTIMILFGLLILQFWNKEVLLRLLRLKNEVSHLDDNLLMDSFMNQMPEKKDEIDHLRYEIFSMHTQVYEHAKTIKTKQIELESLNQSLEQQVQQRTNELVELNNRLFVSELNYRTMVNEFPELVFRLNHEEIFLACEGGLQNQLLMPKEAFLNKSVKEVLPGDLYEQFGENKNKALLSKETQEYEYSLTLNNVIHYYKAKLVPQNNDEFFLFISDITPTVETIKQIEQLSYCDQLTGLYNRRFLEIEYERLNSVRNLPFTVLALDVNGLKLINDAFGHHSGDYLLKEAAKAIKGNLRSEDIVARMGGDEFVVLLPNTNEIIAKELVNRIQKDVNSIDVNGIAGSISIGHCTATEQTMVLDEILKCADDIMYTIKNHEGQAFRYNTVLSMKEKLIRLSECEKVHSEHVYETALRIGEKLNMSEVDLINLGIAAKYHDIGKLAIPDKILLKDSALSIEEYEKVKRHSEIGYQIIKSSDQLRHVAESVLYHHEKWDGSGYPSSLIGESIPLFSRILHVADAFESMIHYRSYKTQMTVDEAMSELNEHAGKQFDPDIVKALIEVLSEENPIKYD